MQELEENFKKNGGRFEKVRLETLFDVRSNPQLNKNAFVFSEKGKYPYFTRTVTNNGILGYVEYLDEKHKIPGNTLAVGMLGMQFFYMKSDFYAGQFTKTIFPKFNPFNEKIALYFIAVLNKCSKYFLSVLVRDFEKIFKETEIMLPLKNNKISFEYIEQYVRELESERVRELESERVRELEAYLIASGLNNYQLTDNEKKILMGGGNCNFKSFKFDEIFAKAQTGDFDIQRIHVNGKGCLYINSGLENQGIVGMTDVKAKIFEPETITVDMFGLAWYRDFAYKMATHAHVFSLSTLNSLSQNCLLYLVGAMFYLKQKYNYNNMCNWSKMQQDSLLLPVLENGQFDTAYMDAYISALKKLVIKDVVEFKDRELVAMKQAVA